MTGKDVKTKLLTSGYVLADVAKEMGIIPQTLNSLLQANDIKTGVLENIAKAINKSIYFFFEVADTSSDCGKSSIPYYDVDFCGGFDLVLNDQTYLPSGYINLPQYSRADSWANITGHSMEPLISNGDIIALRKIEDWQTYMLYGEVYGIMTDEWRTVKRGRKANNPNYIILEPINKDYDEQEIPKSIIRGVWQVLGSIKKFF